MRMLLLGALAPLLAALCVVAAHAEGQANALTPSKLLQALQAKPSGEAATRLATEVRTWAGAEALKKGANPRVEGTTVAWMIEVAKESDSPRLVLNRGGVELPMQRLGSSLVYALAAEFPEGSAFEWEYRVNDTALQNNRLELFIEPPDCREQAGVPKGALTQMPRWKSKVFAGTERDWWVYVPAQYTPEKPACVMVFQDGGSYKNYTPVVFDNLIAKGQMPVTIGVFINPGTFEGGRSNRSFEYDTLSDQYTRFLLEEILPEVEKTYRLRQDAASRAAAGISSGGICAFTVAWERPDKFHKVLSWVGSFTNIASGSSKREGGHNYAALLRKTDPKPIRVFLQAGKNDLDNEHGNWYLANKQMERSLAFKGYDYKFTEGLGFHSDRHGRALLPQSLIWLWRDYRP